MLNSAGVPKAHSIPRPLGWRLDCGDDGLAAVDHGEAGIARNLGDNSEAFLSFAKGSCAPAIRRGLIQRRHPTEETVGPHAVVAQGPLDPQSTACLVAPLDSLGRDAPVEAN